MGRHHRNNPTTMRYQLLKKFQMKAAICGCLISPTIDLTLKERVYHIIGFTAIPIKTSAPSIR